LSAGIPALPREAIEAALEKINLATQMLHGGVAREPVDL
jgi:hypothetical protein